MDRRPSACRDSSTMHSPMARRSSADISIHPIALGEVGPTLAREPDAAQQLRLEGGDAVLRRVRRHRLPLKRCDVLAFLVSPSQPQVLAFLQAVAPARALRIEHAGL